MSKKTAHPPARLTGRTGAMIVGAAIVALALLFSLPKLAQAANTSKPGDLLFPLDELGEGLENLFTFDPAESALDALAQANERQSEAESLVLEASRTNCQNRDTTELADPQLITNLTTALNLFAQRLDRAETEALSLRKDTQTYENLMAHIVETNLHHLLIWESMSQFVPTEASGILTKTAELMSQSTQQALASLPEGRRQDIATRTQINTQLIASNIRSQLASCVINPAAGVVEGSPTGIQTGTTGTNSRTGTTTTGTNTNTTGTSRTNDVSTLTRTVLQQVAGPTQPPGNNPQPTSRPNPNPTTPPLLPLPSTPLPIPTDFQLSVGLDDANTGATFNLVDLNPNDGDGLGVNLVPDVNTEENDTGCNGAKILGICIGG